MLCRSPSIFNTTACKATQVLIFCRLLRISVSPPSCLLLVHLLGGTVLPPVAAVPQPLPLHQLHQLRSLHPQAVHHYLLPIRPVMCLAPPSPCPLPLSKRPLLLHLPPLCFHRLMVSALPQSPPRLHHHQLQATQAPMLHQLLQHHLQPLLAQ